MAHSDACVTGPASGRFTSLLVLATIMGCGHTEPFASKPLGTGQPFDPSPPVRLTLNRGPDRRAAWLPDGSALLYSTQLPARRDHDVCLAVLPPTGGRQRSLTCDVSPAGSTLTESIESVAPASDGRLAYVAATSPIGALTPSSQELVLASVPNPTDRKTVLSLPYTLPGGRLHGGLSQLRWLGPDRLVYLGESVTVLRPCTGCTLDTLRSGLDVVSLSLTGATAVPQPVPGTDYASGVSPGGNEDEIYYTLGGDTRVYRRVISTGAVSVIRDFGVEGIARDVDVAGTQMAVVVGGQVAFANDPSLGPTQWDSGGVLHLLNLEDGTDMTLSGPGLARRPQLSPSGTGVIAELYPVGAIPESRNGDLYLFGQP
jgi:hypothetical protein